VSGRPPIGQPVAWLVVGVVEAMEGRGLIQYIYIYTVRSFLEKLRERKILNHRREIELKSISDTEHCSF
jgi:hypothetical protein